MSFQFGAAGKELELNDENQANHCTAQTFYQIDNRSRCAAGGQLIVGVDDAMTISYGVKMYLQRVLTIFEIVRDRSALGR